MLRWWSGTAPADAPAAGSLVRLIRSSPTGEATAVKAYVDASEPTGLTVKTAGPPSPYEQRGYARTEVALPLRVRAVDAAEASALRAEIVGANASRDPSPGPSARSQAAEPGIVRIERKLDLILAHLGLAAGGAHGERAKATSGPASPGPTARGAGWLSATMRDLSGSGTRFVGPGARDRAVGDMLEVQFEVPGPAGAPYAVRALVGVVRVGTGAAGPEIAVRFKAVSERNRGEVVRYTVERSRADRRAA